MSLTGDSERRQLVVNLFSLAWSGGIAMQQSYQLSLGMAVLAHAILWFLGPNAVGKTSLQCQGCIYG